MDALVGPGAHAGHGEQVDGVVRRALLEELQRAVHAAGLVTVHAARDEHPGAIVAYLAAAHREQRIAVRWIVELAVFLHVESRGEPFDADDDVVGILAKLALSRQPLRALGSPPGNAGSANRIRVRRCHPPKYRVPRRRRNYCGGSVQYVMQNQPPPQSIGTNTRSRYDLPSRNSQHCWPAISNVPKAL